MSLSRTSYVIIASTLALLALILFQVKWMSNSRALIEEQFNRQVQMALCFAVDNLGDGKFDCSSSSTTGCSPISPLEPLDAGYEVAAGNRFDAASLDSALAVALNFYDIQLDYEVYIKDRGAFKDGKYPKHSCSLLPLAKDDKRLLVVNFTGKDSYIMGKMRFMLISSLVILLFITTVFVFANYTLLRQKQLRKISHDFFNNMAHEFRTPLTNINLASSLLKRRLKDAPQEQQYLDVVKSESGKLMHQLERVLHLAKLENGEYQLEKEEVAPETLIRQAIEDMAIQIEARQAEVDLWVEESDLRLLGDRFHLGNAFRNLLDNALKYSDCPPIVKIRLFKRESGVVIQFEDQGIGISSQDQDCVFEKYQRVSMGDVHDRKGFGLGLAYVKMIVERHRGFIKVFSDLNKGTRFDMFLPTN